MVRKRRSERGALVLRGEKLAVGVVPANDVAQTIVSAFLDGFSLDDEEAEKDLRKAAWLGGVFAVAEERVG